MFTRLQLLFAVAILPILCSVSDTQQSSAPQRQAQPCAEAQQHEFDFWVGEWDLTWPGTKHGEIARGSNTIKRTLGGCVIEESFSGGESMLLRGMSVSTFDARAGKWKQTWVDNQGGYLDFVGGFKDGQMVLTRDATGPDGTPIQQRMVWKNIAANELDWSWERSLDGGKTWEVLWTIHYKRKV